ncbi:hypothetical protein P280DRAFT_545626 [Massarina eburnea CBS 473.64]|uniref:Uncharacterized protein n=1 Tax=Massarina eburnea CBS 473.64 TaxID=1395130 RepID=A0A6A6SFK8_9PLEO|nr:hypothetical protein P280DRAFT_545626 [Massarina eburnea CBS 473.64]
MAYNWDKLVKAQRDYSSKPKFALEHIARHLKKRPTDPYVLAWKAKVLLQQNSDPAPVLSILQALCQRQPPIVDLPLLAEIYSDLLEATRQFDPRLLSPPSVGDLGIKAWQNAAKALPSQKLRLKLWSDLFVIAMREDCWEDVRYALVHANKEGPRNRSVHYASIFANQLSAEKKIEASRISGSGDASSSIQQQLALKHMADAFNSPKDDTMRVTSMRDMRFMAWLYQRQKRCADLENLWMDARNPVGSQLLLKYESDMRLILVRAAQECQDWKSLEKICTDAIDSALKSLDNEKSIAPLKQICTTGWLVWSGFLEATTNIYEHVEAKTRITELFNRFRKAVAQYPQEEDRSIKLATLFLGVHTEAPDPASICINYWQITTDTMRSFTDICRMVTQLSMDQQRKFHAFIVKDVTTLKPATKDASMEDMLRWLRAETSVMLFEYSMIISTLENPDYSTIAAFVVKALRLYQIAMSFKDDARSDIAQLVIMGFLRLETVTQDDEYCALRAALFVRHMLSKPDFRDSRVLNLIATRLHLRLGLGTVAFQHWTHCKVKEMLHDTLSWALLTRISQTHPFEIAGKDEFSADAELSKAINTIQRMDAKTDDHLYGGIHDFHYDVASDMLELKRKLRSSLTKHMCMIERRRIARLRSRVLDRNLELNIKDYLDVSDNQDFEVVPIVGRSGSPKAEINMLMSDPPVTAAWVLHYHLEVEIPSRLVYAESSLPRYKDAISQLVNRHSPLDSHPATDIDDSLGRSEIKLRSLWRSTNVIARHAFGTECLSQPVLGEKVVEFKGRLNALHESFRVLHARAVSETEGIVPQLHLSEYNLKHLYGSLEYLRMVSKLCVKLKEAATTKLDKAITKALVKEVSDEINGLYTCIRKLVSSELDRLERDGVSTIVSATYRGPTGDLLRAIISEGDLRRYAKEYVESGIASLKCVLKVKLD